MSLTLHGTPLSHFTRKIRVLLAELDVPFELVWTPGVMSTDASAYADNPLMRVPTLVDGGDTIIESDHIARYLVARHDPDDRLRVRSERVRDLNRLAVINGIMANEVVVILARRGGLENVDSVVYLRKLLGAIERGLAWLDADADVAAPELDYVDVATICMWQHLQHYQLVTGLDRYPKLAARVARHAERPSIASTAPEASLATARAAGWKPG